MKKSPTYLEDRICLNVLANSVENAKECFENGASYLGLGSGMFNKQDIEELNVKNLAQSMKELLAAI